MKRLLLTLAVLFAHLAHGAEYTPPSARVVPWTPGTTVGVQGGIPTSHATTVTISADNTGATDVSATIQAAIDAAATTSGRTLIILPAGTYRCDSTLNFGTTRKYVTLRGAGVGTTTIDSRNAAVAVSFGGGNDYLWAEPFVDNVVTAGQTKGSTVLTVGATSDYIVGGLMNIQVENQTDDAAITAGAVPVISLGGYPRVRQQKVRLVSKTSTTLTITPGLYDDYAGLEVLVKRAAVQTDFCGIEDLTIFCETGSTQYGVTFGQSVNCWARNVKVTLPNNFAFAISDSLFVEIRECYADRSISEGGTHAGISFNSSSGCLIENNILAEWFPHIEGNGGASGNVFGYNLLYDSSVFGVNGVSLDTNHSAHNSYNLFEGNITPTAQSDGYAGGESEGTLFRNWLHGTNPGTANTAHAFILNRFARNFNLVGNILGWPGVRDAATSYGNSNGFSGPGAGNAQPTTGDFWVDWKMSAELTDRTRRTTATAAGAITGSGNASVVVTGAGITGSPLTVSVAVTNGDSAATWAGKVRTALNATGAITALYTVGGSSETITLSKSASNHDATLNISLDNGTCTGIVPAPTSTFAGTPAVMELNSGSLSTNAEFNLWWNSFGNHAYTLPNNSTVSGTTVTFTMTDSVTPLPDIGTTVQVFPFTAGFQETDLDVEASLIAKGNYYSSELGTGEIPSGESLSGDTLPSSLYLSAKPSWFGSKPWPLFDATNPLGVEMEQLPAGHRYFNGNESYLGSSATATATTVNVGTLQRTP